MAKELGMWLVEVSAMMEKSLRDDMTKENWHPIRLFCLEDNFDMEVKRTFRNLRNQFLVEITFDSPIGYESGCVPKEAEDRIVLMRWNGAHGTRGFTRVWVRKNEFHSLNEFRSFMKTLKSAWGNSLVDDFSDFRVTDGSFEG